ncbi:MAG: hypothetical protein JSW58_07255 [Candidatus Latescibacterota bacterium]|nr:MAG: hypothetical protein JSW58_07255 [Candidatus Latescibacterota bacterium]
MKKTDVLFVVAFFAIVALVVPANSQSLDEPPKQQPALRAGAWALQFQVNDNFSLDAFQGAVLSVKRHRSDRSAFRAGLGMGFGIADVNSTVSQNDSVANTENRDESRQFVRLDLQYIRYSNPGSPVKLLFGGGPLVSFSNADTEAAREIGSVRSESTSWATGISGLVGVEWFAASRISLHAEYGVELLYRYTKSSSEARTANPTHTEQTRHMGDFQARGVSFGLSAYF